jgi:hypothetical protein
VLPLTLNRVNDLVYQVLSPQGLHVGYLKKIGAAWKFKAIGYEPDGSVVPGGGPLTERHNTPLADLDEALLNAALNPAVSPTSPP